MTLPSDPPPPSLAANPPARPGSTQTFQRFRQLTFHAVLAGLCPLVPVPFLDDWLLARVRRFLVNDLDRSLDLGLEQEVRTILAGGGDGWRFPGCAAGCTWVLQKVVLRLLIKLSRKVLYFLAIREGLHAATQVFHEGYLLAHALGPVEQRRPAVVANSADAARQLRRVVLTTIDTMDLTPVRDTLRRTFKGSRRLLLRASRVLAKPFLSRRRRRRMRDQATARATAEGVRRQEEALLGSLVDRLAHALWGNRHYLTRLEEHFEAQRTGHVEG